MDRKLLSANPVEARLRMWSACPRSAPNDSALPGEADCSSDWYRIEAERAAYRLTRRPNRTFCTTRQRTSPKLALWLIRFVVLPLLLSWLRYNKPCKSSLYRIASQPDEPRYDHNGYDTDDAPDEWLNWIDED